MQRIGNPIPLFVDFRRGIILDGGYIYVGTANADPQVSPINVFSDSSLLTPLAQPIRTISGYAVSGVTPVSMFISQADFSMRILDSTGALVVYSPSVYTDTSSFQPLDSDLTAIANQGTTAYGRGLLNLANQAALKSATGIPDPLPLTGGTLSGETTHQGAGVELYYNNNTLQSGKIFDTGPTGTDPTTAPGHLWFKLTS